MDDRCKYFIEYFEERVHFLESYCLERIEGLILISCCLDSLAGYVYKERGNNRYPQFKNFIITYSELHEYWNKISLPLLKKHFEKFGDTYHADFLRKMGVSESSYFQKGYNVDIPLPELMNRAGQFIFTPFTGELIKTIERFEYTKIFWKKYRHYSIHEFRSDPDRAPNIFDEELPFYNHETVMASGEENIKMGFPMKFLILSLKNCIKNIKKELELGNIIIPE